MKTALHGRSVIVTGASSGIGEAAARVLAQAGAGVVVTARRGERLRALAGRIEAAGGRAHAVAADLTSAADRQRIVEESVRAFGGVDALVNNAGYGQRGPVERIPLEAVRRQFEVNVFAPIGLTQLVLPLMRERGNGRVVLVGSVAGRIALPFSAVYAATKHALEAISDGLRREVEPFGIRVVLVQPGFVATEFLDAAESASRPVVESPGPYTEWSALREKQGRRSRRLAAPPEVVARVVLSALTAARPRARYAVPAHARVALAVRRLLPDRAFDAALDAFRR